MISLIKKDIRLLISNKNIFPILLLYIPFIVFIGFGDINFTYLASVITFSYMPIATVFQYEIKNKTHILINSLPVKKSTIVFSRYLYTVINFIGSIIFSYIYFKILYIIGLDTRFEFSITNFNQIVFTVVFSMSIILPIHFSFNPKIANFLGMMVYVFNITFSSEIESLLNKFNLVDINIFFNFMLVLIIFLLSFVLSNFIYNKRNFS